MPAQSLFQIVQMKHQMKQALEDVQRLLNEWAVDDAWPASAWTTVVDVSFAIIEGEVGIRVKFSDLGHDQDRDEYPAQAASAQQLCGERGETLKALYNMPIEVLWPG